MTSNYRFNQLWAVLPLCNISRKISHVPLTIPNSIHTVHPRTPPNPPRFRLTTTVVAVAALSDRCLESNPPQNPFDGSFLKWISGFAVGSGVGLLYWSSPDSDFFKTSSFADWSTAELGLAVEDRPSGSLFRKLSLPEVGPGFIFGAFTNLTSSYDILRGERILVICAVLLLNFSCFLIIPESSFSVAFKMFDLDDSGQIDKEEFKKVMALMRACNRQGAYHRDGLRTGLKVNGSVEDGGLVEYFFGNDGKDSLEIDKFVKFLRDLQDEMVRLEFSHYDYKLRGTILAKDFALSMVASADMSHLSNLLDRVEELSNKPHLRDVRITFEEFKNSAELRKKLQPFSLALFSNGKANGMLTREDFQCAAAHVCGVSLTDNVVEIVFQLFDFNQDGNLSLDEFVRVLQRWGMDVAQEVETGIMIHDSNPRRAKLPFQEETMCLFLLFFGFCELLLEYQMGRPIGKKKDHEVQKPVAHLHSSMAACYIQMGIGEYPRAINECNLALAVSPKYSKALLKRAFCYEALNRLDLALRDVYSVLNMEPNNLSALEILASVKRVMNEKGIVFYEKEIGIANVQQPAAARFRKVVKEKLKKKGKKIEQKMEDKVVVEEKVSADKDKEVVMKIVGEDKVVMRHVEEEKLVTKHVEEEKVVAKPVKLGVLVKYKDEEGDLVTITTTDELRIAESSSDMHDPLRLFIAGVSPDQEPIYEGLSDEEVTQVSTDNRKPSRIVENGDNEKDKEVEKRLHDCSRTMLGLILIRTWDLHELGVKIYSEAMEDAVTLEDAQELFDIAADKFQEMVALALFNWGNVHMSKARKRVSFPEDASRETIIELIKVGYEWANNENKKADGRYEEAVKINPTSTKVILLWGNNSLTKQRFVGTRLRTAWTGAC
ncbi:hypothetical protein DVH24_021139 [Malus domestica]|uniref:EF-hand domain-containing protein n=1 Tax=Malus domestica TaxID=3750 RepID=A0A498JAF7_MALDO|nr:hypothetical protein DVH24_021139 [Malus domestica]